MGAANSKRKGMRAAIGCPARRAGSKRSCRAASTAAASKSPPPDWVTVASVTAPEASMVSTTVTDADSPLPFFVSG